MEQQHISSWWTRFIEVLHLVAAPWNVQMNSFPPFVHVPDEIALEFDEVCFQLQEFVDAGFLRPELKDIAEDIVRTFGQMTSAGLDWTPDALQNAPTWSHVRDVAGTLLRGLGQTARTPRLFWLQFLPSQDHPS